MKRPFGCKTRILQHKQGLERAFVADAFAGNLPPHAIGRAKKTSDCFLQCRKFRLLATQFLHNPKVGLP